MERVREFYDLLGADTRLDEARANEIVRAARPHTETLLQAGPEIAGGVQVTARLVEPAVALGGSLIPAWPLRGDDGRVTIEFVADWGAMLAGWCASVADTGGEATGDRAEAAHDLVQLVRSGERQWVGIANDVLQLYVPNPPDGTYSMVRHHALMLVAATLWLGADRARRWLDAHSLVARAFLARLGGRSLWAAIESAETGLRTLLADPRARRPADEVISWLDADPDAAQTYREYLGTASLGLAALLATAPSDGSVTGWLQRCIYEEHTSPDFNRDRIEAFAR